MWSYTGELVALHFGLCRGAECSALLPMVARRAGGTDRWMEKEDMTVQASVVMRERDGRINRSKVMDALENNTKNFVTDLAS